MQSFKLMCLKTAIILTFVAGLVIAMGNAKYLWLLLLLIPSFFADLCKIQYVNEIGKIFKKVNEEVKNEQRKSD